MGGEHVRPVVVAAGVDVDAVIVDERSEALDNDPVPVRETTETAANQLYVRVRPPHHFGEFAGLLNILLGRERPDLPLPVHFVAEAPILDVVGLLVSVL